MKRRKLILLTLIFSLPILLGTMYFQYRYKVSGQDTLNYGELVSPMKSLSLDVAEGFWTYVVFVKTCDNLCRQRLLSAETTRVLTHENMRRVRTMFLSTEQLKESDKPKNLPPHIILPSQQPVTEKQWNQWSKETGLSLNQLTTNILLLDPHNNLMMRYPTDKQDPKKMLLDMKRLLKYSRIG